MVFESTEIINGIGIAAEILGFILMIKYYGKKPTESDWQNWKTRNLTNKGFEKWEEKDIGYIEMAHTPKGLTDPVHRRFVDYWGYKTRYIPLGLVIGGLFLQLLQLLVD